MTEEPKQQSWWQTLPGILTAIGAVLTAVTGLIVALQQDGQSKVTPVAQPPISTVLPQVPPLPNLSGVWRDNWGTVYQLTQSGNAFQYTAEGTSCRGGYFQSSGSGSVTGNSVQSTYQSSIPSRGSCSGTLSSNGQQVISTCTDSVCGAFTSSTVRQ
jgi:hypothetical protein